MFQSTFPQGERLASLIFTPLNHFVSIHVPARGTTLSGGRHRTNLCGFNPRSRKGNDGTSRQTKQMECSFNPRSRKGNDYAVFACISFFACFNPRSRKGNDKVAEGPWITSTVSIHVPARGTTGRRFRGKILNYRFNPRSRKGNDRADQSCVTVCVLFQSTFPQGERRQILYVQQIPAGVSIHVPARGTTYFVEDMMEYFGFQSTFPQGERQIRAAYEAAKIGVSIHVPARGTTSYQAFNSALSIGFNPRSRKGNDHQNLIHLILLLQFQSTFPQGERQTSKMLSTLLKLFQSTFPQGERLDAKADVQRIEPFQSTFPQGERHLEYDIYWFYCPFQSTFPQGERRALGR